MIHTRALTRTFRTKGTTVEAVRGLDIDVEAGELLAFLGPNGAGKSTSLRMLTTLLLPTSGSATVAGCDIVSDPRGVRRRIGYVGQGRSAGVGQRVRDELVTQGRCYGMSHAEARTRADELLEVLELDGTADREVEKLSGGQQRRLDIAMGLIHRPALLFLDEPSTGLDPHSRANLWEHIARLRAENGMTIVLTTHYLDEADAIADRVVVVDHGTVIADGTSDELKGKVSGDQVTFTTEAAESARRAAAAVERVPSAHAIDTDGTTVRMRVERGDAVLPELLRVLGAAGVEPLTVQVQRPTLDDVFLTLTGRSLRDGDQEGEK
ncbi:ATP-binding cassette domain-containing protein [Nocardiopsis rhodophaea]|uniref:ATP-binding cassette domain-containing protein n=1 Tax=Nocardiopsis rhodophaea TaxID=280238 RepID=A0ABN2SSC6_9ACTN